jgi:hypothetical protein
LKIAKFRQEKENTEIDGYKVASKYTTNLPKVGSDAIIPCPYGGRAPIKKLF